jgi:hypothetical protein
MQFGPYTIDVDGDHATIWRTDDAKVEPTFYEMQHMKSLAFGGAERAVEVFPRSSDLVDGQNQRHLWRVPEGFEVPNLRTGRLSWRPNPDFCDCGPDGMGPHEPGTDCASEK